MSIMNVERELADRIHAAIIDRHKLPKPTNYPIVFGTSLPISFTEYVYAENHAEMERIMRAFAEAAAAAQIAEYARTGRVSERKPCFEEPLDKIAGCGVAVVNGVPVRLAPVRAHGALVASKYWRKACLPVRPGPAARALIALGLAVAPAQVSALLRFKEPPRSRTIAAKVNMVYRVIPEYASHREAANAAKKTVDVAYRSDAPLGPLAAALYVISYITRLKIQEGHEIAENVVFLANSEDDAKYRCAMAVEFCKSNIYVWSPVRRYRLVPPVSRIITTIAEARREMMKLCK